MNNPDSNWVNYMCDHGCSRVDLKFPRLSWLSWLKSFFTGRGFETFEVPSHGAPGFGIDAEVLEEVRISVTHIILNGEY